MKILLCRKCNLHNFRRNVVQGRGFLPADICIIGEAPGKTEDMLNDAFVGQAGKLLDSMIHDAENNIDFSPKIYFTNTVLCRPTDRIGGDNRPPTKEEVFLCSQNVQEIISKTKAKEFILAGDIAEKYMKSSIKHYTKIMHPSAILRNGGKSSGYYLETIRKLKTVFRRLKNAKK